MKGQGCQESNWQWNLNYQMRGEIGVGASGTTKKLSFCRPSWILCRSAFVAVSVALVIYRLFSWSLDPTITFKFPFLESCLVSYLLSLGENIAQATCVSITRYQWPAVKQLTNKIYEFTLPLRSFPTCPVILYSLAINWIDRWY